MNYRYYIANNEDGTVYGTNDLKKAKKAAEEWYNLVIDINENKWFLANDILKNIEEYPYE